MSLRRFQRIPPRVAEVLRRPPVLYTVVLCGLAFGILVSWPIVKLDTDLWFHLSWGRYLFERHAIPHDSYFSFISPTRQWIDYAWLFQAAVYACYDRAGYVGLVVLRAGLCLATLGLIARYLFWRQTGRPAERAWSAFVFALIWLVLLVRFQNVRPFLVTDLCLAVFLYVLERHPRRSWVLVPVAVLWSNAHGIAYPFLLLVTGAYCLEYLWARGRGMRYNAKDERLFYLPAILCMLAVFLTPHHLRLLGTPFRPLGFLSDAVSELWPVDVNALLSFELVNLAPTFQTVNNVLLLVIGLSLAYACLSRRVRISHVVLCVTGLGLVMKGFRFVPECALLALPVLKHFPLWSGGRVSALIPKPAALAVVVLLMAMPVRFASTLFGHRPAYPFSHRGLPEGLVTFLDHLGVGGDVFNYANNGGYLRWRLYPRHRIYSDMEALFTDEDLYLGQHAFHEEPMLRRVMTRYDPSFLAVPIDFSWFKDLIANVPDYSLVFFDDVEVLYVNRRHYPDIAKTYQLQEVDPYHLSSTPVNTVLAESDAEAQLRSLARIVEIYPGVGIARRLLAARDLEDGAFKGALEHAEAIIGEYPESAVGYRFKGDALHGLGLPDRSLSAYRLALQRSRHLERKDVYRRIGTALLEAQRHAEAYRYLRKGVDVFHPETAKEHLYQLASAARLTGDPRVAEAALTYLYRYRLTADDAEWRARVRRDLDVLGVKLEDEP